MTTVNEALDELEVDVIIERTAVDIYAPQYKTNGAACFDIAPFFADRRTRIHTFTSDNTETYINPEFDEDAGEFFIVVGPYGRVKLPTGLRFGIREGYELEGRLRSSAFKHTLRLTNGVMTIDCDYRGEVFICVENVGITPMRVISGERMVQLKYQLATQARLADAGDRSLEDLLPPTTRGDNAFGSTGTVG